MHGGEEQLHAISPKVGLETGEDDLAQLSRHLRKLDSTLASARATATRSASSKRSTEKAALARMDTISRQLSMMPI